MSKDFDYSEQVRNLQVPTLIVAADADMAPPSHYVEIFKLLDGGLRDGGWIGEGRPKGGRALATLPGLTHYNLGTSQLFAAARPSTSSTAVGVPASDGRERPHSLPRIWDSCCAGQPSC